MKFPENLKYTQSHEWFDPATGKVGITDHAQGELGDVVYLDFAVEPGESVDAGGTVGTVESVKTVSDIYAPVSGSLKATNEAIQDKPELVNEDPYGEGWLFQLENTGDLSDGMMDATAYQKLVGIA
ncbi:MAG: glycine cleavage system protein GcvH [Deltaproteobacteria bacterium]|nr:MAG: glycine cleavage system protein GcvH [Deltaproteobacteria bacterium]